MHRMRILYVEDEISTQQLVKLYFKKEEIQDVEFADNGEEALKLCKQKEYDLIITDMMMPKMDGLTLIAEVKKLYPQQIFAMVTAMDDKDDLIKAIQYRVNYFIPKPINKTELITCVEQSAYIVSKRNENKKLQQQLQRQHQMFEQLLSKQQSLVIITDFDKTTYASQSFLRFFDVGSEEEFDKRYGSLLNQFICHPEYLCADSAKELQSKYDFENPNTNFVWIEDKKKSEPFSFLLDMHRFENQKSTYLLTLTDVSLLQKKKTSLQNDVQKQLQKLQYQEKVISHQSKLASVGEMLDAVAHQWNQPLNIISLQAQMLEFLSSTDELSKQEIQKIVDSISHQVTHMHTTLQEFRNFFRPVKEFQVVCVKTLVDSVLLLLKDELISNGVSVSVKGNFKAKIEILPNEFKHVLINLLNNAKDAYNDNKIDKAKREIILFLDEQPEHFCLTVQDSAGGIKEELIETLFEANVTSKEYGTGIGLYMSKQIVEKIGGTLCVKNFEDGAVFTIKLLKEIKKVQIDG